MSIEVIGISGSPVKNSNTDRLIKAVLNATKLETEFIKLSRINVRPCFACKKCVSDNICKVKDDFQELAEIIKNARAIVIGAYSPYGQIDGFTKALLERFWSLRHQQNLLKGKFCATVLTGIDPNAMDRINQSLATEIRDYENMILISQLSIQGNLPCLTCGEGDHCKMSAIKVLYGPDAKASHYSYSRVEDQNKVWKEAIHIGKLISERIRNTANT